MADVLSTTAPAEVTTSPKKTTKKEKKSASKPRVKSSHPPTAVMVNGAIAHLKERGGSSLQAIKKYISATYKIDAEKFSPFIRKYLKSSVATGGLVQTKGKGASGSFKLASAAVTKVAPKVKKSAPKPRAAKPVEKKSPVKKAAKPKKSPIKKKVVVAAVKEVKPKTPSKVKRTAKAPTKKPKSPKPKTTKAKAGKPGRKAAPKKK